MRDTPAPGGHDRIRAGWFGTGHYGRSMPVIEVDALAKVFQVPVRQAGLKASLRSLVHRETRSVAAVAGVTFAVDQGEVVGFLGPNGAGKTTTLKMLSGLLHPSAGTGTVLGHTPARRERAFLGRIALVMGNRNQLQWDLPALDSFELNRAVYGIARADFVRQRDELIELLDLGDLVTKPVRNLSLGERMKAEIAGSLLHRPSVLFLDEPTLGLDVTMQRRIRGFLADYASRHGATILLTSHYMADVEALCRRVVLIHHGSLLFDGELGALADRFSATRTLVVRFADEPPLALDEVGHEVARDGASVTLRVDKARVAAVTGDLLSRYAVADLTIEDPPIDDVIERAFAAPVTP